MCENSPTSDDKARNHIQQIRLWRQAKAAGPPTDNRVLGSVKQVRANYSLPRSPCVPLCRAMRSTCARTKRYARRAAISVRRHPNSCTHCLWPGRRAHRDECTLWARAVAREKRNQTDLSRWQLVHAVCCGVLRSTTSPPPLSPNGTHPHHCVSPARHRIVHWLPAAGAHEGMS